MTTSDDNEESIGGRERQNQIRLSSPLAEAIVVYSRMTRFTGPDQSRRYFRIFGDLEYDLLALRAESTVMAMRLREVKRRIGRQASVTTEDERQIAATAHDLSERLYARADALRTVIAASRSFRFDRDREEQCYYLFYDITIAIMGIASTTARAGHRQTMEQAQEAYGLLDLSTLLDLHDLVQPLLSLERRERLDPAEENAWRARLEEYMNRYPLRLIALLETPERIERRMASLKRKISAEQNRLEHQAMLYMAAVKISRVVN